MIRPGLQIEVEAVLEQVIPFPNIAGSAERVLEPDRTIFDFGKRKIEIALAGMGPVIHNNQHPFAGGALPGMGDE